MNPQRAQEIAESPVMADVTCDGVPVYIQHVDAENDTARIYPLDQPDQEQTVALGTLVEASPFQGDGIHMLCPPDQGQ
ncbi:H-type small acid-soluble spore protein [Paenibacillus sp. T1]|uniref:H-type small acid-soluble spore protein n=1 Tax=Paenibacillus glycinis TaxID=2697035 RepID=A0ABW9XPC4_9BACL|nr:H-type small acid-soluble spore protein [Paenibacillus glycinis]